MRYLSAVAFLFFAFASFSQSNAIAIIPEPVSIVQQQGVFTLKDNITIAVTDDNEAVKVAGYLSSAIAAPTGFATAIKKNGNDGNINLIITATPDKALGSEGYSLVVSPESVTITANQAAGLFYGVQSFMQLLPKAITGKFVSKDVSWTAPCVEITDYPRFGWRGLMFDVSRHFFTKEEVKQFIDDMAKYKFNLLHMHLTDDQGWRIEIKSLPKLTSVGAWNVKKTGTFNYFSAPGADEPRNYGGFYTHDDIKEIIQYAKDQFINVLPEVDVPGHSLAAIASYPELSCTPGADKYKVNSGEPFMVWPSGGHFYGLVDNTLCPANEKVYEFLDKVFTEVAQLFPFEYIHMGGDETARNFWEKSAAIKALMKKENLKNLDEVQSYFVKRVEKIIESKGKKMIGWDEILQGGLAPNAAVMSWRGIKGGIEAAKQKHEVVMSPTTFAYLDYMQGDAAIEPPVYATLRLNKAYQFEPVPDGVDPIYIKGGQANLWTEQVYNMRHLQYMIWPRAFAIAESVWSPKAKKNWNSFVPRVEKQFERFDVAEIKYSPAVYDPVFKITKGEKNLPLVELSTEINGLDIYYSFDNSFPDQFYPKYTKPLTIPKDAATMKVITYRASKPIGRMIVITAAELKKRAGIK
ncbi:family 20 glycosylhydrolase [Agriterribacter sp.]|uniref:beta-N-acetylhexosaminidase n=1 Tax=Agriterribacter sp. TaxID=2821509 RepID=UPI002B8C1FBB|nr:family 20 glycosylhydrolase [Agriterribacter sp.]HRO48489.1 family 20 glycosylhydrolase [Agriterribacter sp.]HRQ16604.1 family 20 glycosylhydrolase [Agriterribacter sp.]